MSTFPRGSEWRRWDLHVHSPLSILNNQFDRLETGEPDWETYIAALENAPVSVYGITDYFTIDGYKELRRRQEDDGRLAGKTLLPNVEFRLDQVLSSRHDGKRIIRLNLHVIFAEDVSVEDIEEHFLHDLNFVYEEDPTDSASELSLKPANLARLGEKLIEEHAEFKGMSAIQLGASKAIVTIKSIKEQLRKDSRFTNKYLLVLVADGWDNISWDGQDHQIRKTLLQASAMVFTGSPKSIAWCLGKKPYEEGPEAFRREFKTLKPCIHGSDAHSIDQIAKPCAKRAIEDHDCAANASDCDMRNCWIKADPTFEGLRQVLYEPEERVRIQTADPTPSKTQYCISALNVADTPVNSELHLAKVSLPLNSGLVAITGGRGSGKTALVDLLAHCFVDRANTDDKNSFVRRVADSGAHFETSLRFASDGRFSKTLLDGEFVEDSNVVYIAQGELEQYIGEGSDLNTYVHDLIFNSIEIKNSVTAYEYETLGGEVAECQGRLEELNREISEGERETAPTVLADLKKGGIQAKAEVVDLGKRVETAKKKLTAEKVKAAEDRQKALATLKERQQKLVGVKTALQNASRFIATDMVRFAEAIAGVNVAVKALDLGPHLAVPVYPDAARLTSVASTVDEQIRATLSEIAAHEKGLGALKAEQKEHATLLNKKQEAEIKHGRLQQRWKELTSLQQKLVERRQQRSADFKLLLQTVSKRKDKYESIIQAFSGAKDEVLRDLDFRAEIVLDGQPFVETANDLLDKRQVQVVAEPNSPSEFDELFRRLGRIAAEGDQAIDAVVEETDRLCEELRGRLKGSKLAGAENLFSLLYRSYLSVEPVVRYKNTALDRLSMGQKATVLMKIYLAEGDSPIIIDSHDDHLDNESIMDELVGSIRQAKHYRQVILASNNGNVVINSDADQLIIAYRTGIKIEYMTGSLEDGSVRARALKVLEGGEEAFRRRQDKYRLGR